MKKIGVLTSGGDAPGMNACIRAVVRTALARNVECWGITNGLKGMTNGEGEPLHSYSVAGILRHGGTILGTGRFPAFSGLDMQQEAVRSMCRLGVDGVVVAGGDGSMRGAKALDALGYPVIGVPCSIDNDISGTDMSIGTDTAMNTALEAIDRIKDAASSHQRAMVVEVMGNNCGYLAQMVGLAAGAEMVVTPESDITVEEILKRMSVDSRKGKKHFIIVLAEGARWNGSELQARLSDAVGAYETRHTVLGYTMRGGTPSALDRILATGMGMAAANGLLDGVTGAMTSWQHNRASLLPFSQVTTNNENHMDGVREMMEVTTL